MLINTLSGRLALSLDAALLEALVAAPAVLLHAPQLRDALQQVLATRSPMKSSGGRGPGGMPGVFGVQAFTSDGRTSRTAVRPALWGCCLPCCSSSTSDRVMRTAWTALCAYKLPALLVLAASNAASLVQEFFTSHPYF